MFSSLLCVLLAFAAPAERPRVSMMMECCPESPQLGDVMIVKITARNHGDAPVDIPSVYDPILGYLRIQIRSTREPYSYEWAGHGHGMGYIPLVPLAPGETRVVAFEAIELAPGTDIRHDFWTDLADADGSVQVQANLSHPDGDRYCAYDSLRTLKRRAPREVDALIEAYTSERPNGSDFDYAPQPAGFGVFSFPGHLATPGKLAELEAELSEGTLRDVLRTSRLMQIISKGDDPFDHDDAQRRAGSQELLSLLDSREPLEREWLAMNIFEWFYDYGAAHDQIPDIIEWEFVEAVAERLSHPTVGKIVGRATGGLRYWPFLEKPQVQQGLVAKLEIDDWRHQLYDPLFTRVRLTNHGKQNVTLGSSLFHNASYWLDDDPLRYRFQSEHGYLPDVGPIVLAAGENLVVDHEVLQTPPIAMQNHSLWHDLAARTAFVETEVSLRVGEAKEAVDLRTAGGLAFQRRPEAEMEFLGSLYAELNQRERPRAGAERRDPDPSPPLPTPETFGLHEFGPHEDLVQQLLEYEEKLSPGELRDIVHLTRLMREMEGETDEHRRLAGVDRVLRFLDTLPPIERHALLIRTIDWCQPLSADSAHHRLADGALKRLPQKLFQYDDYPAARRQELEKEHPRFRDYEELDIGDDSVEIDPDCLSEQPAFEEDVFGSDEDMLDF